MGSSYVEYRGRGFWSWDGYLEHLLALLADSVDETDGEPWLLEAREHWRMQSSGIFSGWIHPRLDELVATEDRQKVVVDLLETVMSRADATPEVTATAAFIIRLLRGELKTDASSPLDYMVTGEHPYPWTSERTSRPTSG